MSSKIRADDGENYNYTVEENYVPPSPLTEEFEEATSSILQSCTEYGLEMYTLAFKCENFFAKVRTQRKKQKSISENCLKL